MVNGRKAMIFAAGIGSRLRPITDSIPKALVPVGGVPMLQRILLQLKSFGFDDVTITSAWISISAMSVRNCWIQVVES